MIKVNTSAAFNTYMLLSQLFCFFLLMKVGNSKAILGVKELKQHKGNFIEHRNSFLNELVINK